MDTGQVEEAQLLADRPPAQFVGRSAAPFATFGKVQEKGGSVVAPEPLVSWHLQRSRDSAVLEQSLQVRQALFEVERGVDLVQAMPRRTIAKATVGWMPTITVSAPRSRAMWARLRRVREPKESMTSSAATSMMMPRAR